MHSNTRRVIVAACAIFVGAAVGHLLQALLPADHLSSAKSAIMTVQALVTGLLALVLGLLVSTSYGVFAQQNSEMMTLVGQVMHLDMLLDQFGADGDRGRALQREQLIAMRKRFWARDGRSEPTITYAIRRAELIRVDGFFAGLKATTDEDRAFIAQARSLSVSIAQTINQMGRQLLDPVPAGLVNSVVLWAALVFCCLGSTATLNALSVTVELVGAASVASAIFLILDFTQPYSGYFRISPEKVDHMIAALAPPPQA